MSKAARERQVEGKTNCEPIRYPTGGFKSAAGRQNLLKQVFGEGGNRLEPVLSSIGGIDPAIRRFHFPIPTAKQYRIVAHVDELFALADEAAGRGGVAAEAA